MQIEKKDFEYDPSLENRLKFNVLNNFGIGAEEQNEELK